MAHHFIHKHFFFVKIKICIKTFWQNFKRSDIVINIFKLHLELFSFELKTFASRCWKHAKTFFELKSRLGTSGQPEDWTISLVRSTGGLQRDSLVCPVDQWQNLVSHRTTGLNGRQARFCLSGRPELFQRSYFLTVGAFDEGVRACPVVRWFSPVNRWVSSVCYFKRWITRT